MHFIQKIYLHCCWKKASKIKQPTPKTCVIIIIILSLRNSDRKKVKESNNWNWNLYHLHGVGWVRPPSDKRNVLNMTPKCIWWWGSSYGAQRKVKYPFIVITPRSTLSQIGSNCWGSIYGSNKSVGRLLISNKNTWYYVIICKLWYNSHHRRKWTWWTEFKSLTRLFVFHVGLIPLEKVWIQLFFLLPWVNSRADCSL